ncbi:MAG: hypothetical protein NTV53_02865, partial [Actinobacteria bacterium]|nr:hypothetical protein [Actinomycetota bacterium]
KVTGDYVSVMTDYKKLMIRLESLKRRYVNNTSLLAMEEKMLKIQISPGDNLSSAIYNIESINKKIDSSIKVWDQLYLTIIECVKGNTTKKVTAKNPKCPKGYKVKL